MKLFIGTAINLCLLDEEERGFKAAGELILMAKEPRWSVDDGGDLVRQSEVSQTRFVISSHGLRNLIKVLGDYADQMDKLETKAMSIPSTERLP